MEINVGDYVRTENGIIGKLVDEYTFKNRRVCYPEPQEWVLEINNNEVSIMESIDNIIKSSKDIIKLLEKGDILVDYKDDLYVVDYVDGYYVFTTAKINKTTIKTLVDYQIKKVLTKEQFEANAYKIEKEEVSK